MRNEPHSAREPRSRLIIRRTEEAIRSSGLNVLKFAARVVDNYMMMVAPDDRIIDFYASHGSMQALLRDEKRNGEMIDRIIKGVTRFSVDLEEAWIAALPDRARADLIRELAARYGLIAARIPSAQSHRERVADLAAVLSDAGDLAKAMAPMFADGKIAADDKLHIRAALIEIDKSLADLTSLRAQLASASVGAVASMSTATR